MTASRTPRTIAVLGLGVMGASIGRALRDNLATCVVGWDPDARAMATAMDRAMVGQAVESPEEAVTDADLVILSAPLTAIPGLAARVGDSIRPKATVTDIGSVKVNVVGECERLFGDRFVGGHPMAGKELQGAEHADPALLRGASWVLTPTVNTSPGSLSLVKDVVTSIGACPVIMTPDEHDRMAAHLSHLPHAVAFALASTARRALDPPAIRHAGGSYRSATRVAAGDPKVWASIMVENREHMAAAINGMLHELTRLRDAVERGDVAGVAAILAAGHCGPRTSS